MIHTLERIVDHRNQFVCRMELTQRFANFPENKTVVFLKLGHRAQRRVDNLIAPALLQVTRNISSGENSVDVWDLTGMEYCIDLMFRHMTREPPGILE